MKASKFLISTFLLIYTFSTQANNHKMNVYLIPGQGADYRLFKNLIFDDHLQVRHVHYSVPGKNMTMRAYAEVLAQQIDTTQRFILIGASLGGMLATEMTQFLNPEKTIVIASAKSRHELPKRYTFQKKVPIYKLVPGKVAKVGAKILQPIVEPDRNKEVQTFLDMLNDKDPLFLRRTIQMIITWERTHVPDDIIHIHGNKDNTLPIKMVNWDYCVEGGSHLMTLTKAEEISGLIRRILQ